MSAVPLSAGDEIDVNVDGAISFFEEHNVVDLKSLCKVILAEGADTVSEHAYAIVISGEDEDDDMKRIYDIQDTHMQTAYTTLSVAWWSRETLEAYFTIAVERLRLSHTS